MWLIHSHFFMKLFKFENVLLYNSNYCIEIPVKRNTIFYFFLFFPIQVWANPLRLTDEIVWNKNKGWNKAERLTAGTARHQLLCILTLSEICHLRSSSSKSNTSVTATPCLAMWMTHSLRLCLESLTSSKLQLFLDIVVVFSFPHMQSSNFCYVFITSPLSCAD